MNTRDYEHSTRLAKLLVRNRGECWIRLTTAEEQGVVYVRNSEQFVGVIEAARALGALVEVLAEDPDAPL